MNEIEKLNKEYQNVIDEMAELFKLYYDYKLRRWKYGFNVADWVYCREFWGIHDYREYQDKFAECYLNFLNRKKRNIKIKINQIKQKKYKKH